MAHKCRLLRPYLARMNLDRNTLIGLLLMLLLGLGFSWYSAVMQEKNPSATAVVADSSNTPKADTSGVKAAAAQVNPAVIAMDSLAGDSAAQEQRMLLQQRFGTAANAMTGEAQEVVLMNDKIRVTFSTKGGMFTSATLVDGYMQYGGKAPISLWDTTLSSITLKWMNNRREPIVTEDLFFTPSATEVNATTETGSLAMRLANTEPSKALELIYTLKPGSYAVECSVKMNELFAEVDEAAAPVSLVWNATGLANEKGIQAERSKCSVYFRPMDDDRDYLSEGSDDELVTETAVNWVAFKQDFFSAAVISPDGFRTGSSMAVKVLEDSTHTKSYSASLSLPQGKPLNQLTFFFGPNDYKVLRDLEVKEFDRIIDYGWSIIGWLNTYAVRPLFWFLSEYIGSFGLIILIVTIIIKMLLFPVTWKNYLSSAKMRVLKPEMDEINKKYEGKEAVEKQQAVMALYRQTGVNPFAGCIPVLIQMPILYAMFRFFPAEIVLRGESFLWADDLAAYDAIVNLPFNIPFYGAHISGFTLLMAASTFVYTRMSSASQPAMTQPGMPNMKVMMNIFTVMMIFFFNSMPSGLSLYYFTANMISIGQMWTIKNYIIDEDAIRAKIEENKKKPRKKSAFQQRLEEAQKSQQQKLDARKGKK